MQYFVFIWLLCFWVGEKFTDLLFVCCSSDFRQGYLTLDKCMVLLYMLCTCQQLIQDQGRRRTYNDRQINLKSRLGWAGQGWVLRNFRQQSASTCAWRMSPLWHRNAPVLRPDESCADSSCYGKLWQRKHPQECLKGDSIAMRRHKRSHASQPLTHEVSWHKDQQSPAPAWKGKAVHEGSWKCRNRHDLAEGCASCVWQSSSSCGRYTVCLKSWHQTNTMPIEWASSTLHHTDKFI